MKKRYGLYTIALFAFITIFSTNLLAQKDYEWEIIYDDGSAEEFSAWVISGGMVAVKFTAPGHPFRLTGGSLYVGDGMFPEGGNFLGTDMVICVFNNDGENGLPGEILDSVRITANNYEWIVFDSIFDVEFYDDNDFYLGMMQVAQLPNCAPIGIDTDLPTVYRSYVKQSGGEWIGSPYQDFMIRAKIEIITGTKEIISKKDIQIFPMPAKNQINFKSPATISAITILDLQGKTVSSNNNINSKNYQINIANLPKGIYLAKITAGNTIITKKIVVKK